MNYEVIKEFENQIEATYETGNDSLRKLIQNRIDAEKELREHFVKEMLMRYHPEYTRLLTVTQQSDIITPLINSVKDNSYPSDEVLILVYASEQVVDEILSNLDNVSLGMLMKAIRKKIEIIGDRLVDYRGQTTIFSRMSERKRWKKLYKKCEKNLKQ